MSVHSTWLRIFILFLAIISFIIIIPDFAYSDDSEELKVLKCSGRYAYCADVLKPNELLVGILDKKNVVHFFTLRLFGIESISPNFGNDDTIKFASKLVKGKKLKIFLYSYGPDNTIFASVFFDDCRNLATELIRAGHAIPLNTMCFKAYDGDYIAAYNSSLHYFGIRIYGIYCPKKGNKGYDEAKQFTNNLIKNKIIKVIPHGSEKGGGMIASVYTEDKKNIGAELIRAGHAFWVKGLYEDQDLAVAQELYDQDKR